MDLENVLTIAQITDLHITNGSQPKDRARNEARLRIIHRYRKMVDGLSTTIPR